MLCESLGVHYSVTRFYEYMCGGNRIYGLGTMDIAEKEHDGAN